MKKLISLLTVALVAFAFSACSSSEDAPKKVVETYLSASQKKDSKKVVELFHFSKEVSAEDKESYEQLLDEKITKDIEKKQGIASYEVGEVTMAEDGNSALVEYTIRYGDGTEETEKIDVVKVDGKWLLDSGK